jgi:hypothetical protein
MVSRFLGEKGPEWQVFVVCRSQRAKWDMATAYSARAAVRQILPQYLFWPPTGVPLVRTTIPH